MKTVTSEISNYRYFYEAPRGLYFPKDKAEALTLITNKLPFLILKKDRLLIEELIHVIWSSRFDIDSIENLDLSDLDQFYVQELLDRVIKGTLVFKSLTTFKYIK